MTEYVALVAITKNAVQGDVTISEHYKPGDIVTLSDESAALHLQRGNIEIVAEAVQENESTEEFTDLWTVPESTGEEE